jgi:4-amino-4-deoxy-L-arabinose transferase
MRASPLTAGVGHWTLDRDVVPGFALLLLFLAVYILVLGERPLFIPDETRYAEIPREMLASGDWLIPRFNGLLYFEKPPLGYWVNAITMRLFGDAAFAVRLPSAVAVGISALLAFAMGRVLFPRLRVAAFGAVFVYLTTLEVALTGTFSVLDPVFALLVDAGIFAFALARWASGRSRKFFLAGAGILLGLAFLTKGLLAFALPALILGPWLLLQRQYRLLFAESWIAVVCALLTALPCALALHLEAPDFWRYFFWVEHVQRFLSPENAQHKEPVYFYLRLLPALAFPWIFLLPGIFRGLRLVEGNVPKSGAISLLVLWIVAPLVFFSISSGKLATYIFPCFVPFAVLAAVGLLQDRNRSRRISWSLALAFLAVILFAGGLWYYSSISGELHFAADERMRKLVLFGSLAFAAICLFIAMWRTRPELRMIAVGGSVIPFLVVLPNALPQSAMASKAPEAFIQEVYAKAPTNVMLIANGTVVGAVSWSTQRDDVYIIEDRGEFRYGLDAPSGAGRFLDTPSLGELVERSPGAIIFCKGPCRADTMAVLPPGARHYQSSRFNAYFVDGHEDYPEPVRLRASP